MPRLLVGLLLFVLLTVVGGARPSPAEGSERPQTVALDAAPAASIVAADRQDPSTPLSWGVAGAQPAAVRGAFVESELSFGQDDAPPQSRFCIIRRARAPPAA